MLKDEYKKCEKINNVIYEQSPSEGFVHAMVMGNVLYAIKRQLKGSGWILTAGNYTLKLSDDEYAVPDIMLFNDKKQITSRGYHGTPAFIAEIEGPLTKVKDRTVKMDAYAKLGVKEYWLIDPMEKKLKYIICRQENIFCKNLMLWKIMRRVQIIMQRFQYL